MQADFNLDPWGEIRGDMRSAIVAQTSLWPHLKEGKDPPALSVFMPWSEHTEAELPTEEELGRKIAAAFGMPE